MQVQPLQNPGFISGVATAPTSAPLTMAPTPTSAPISVQQPEEQHLDYVKNSPDQPNSEAVVAPLPDDVKQKMVDKLTAARTQYPGQDDQILQQFIQQNKDKYPVQIGKLEKTINYGQDTKGDENSSLSLYNNPMGLKNPATGQFERFKDPTTGFQAGLQDLENKISGNSRTGTSTTSTLLDLSKAWAGTGSNNVTSWAQSVAGMLGVSIDTPIGQIDPTKLASAVAKHETGYTPTTPYDSSSVLDELIKQNTPTPSTANGTIGANGKENVDVYSGGDNIKSSTNPVLAGLLQTGDFIKNGVESIPKAGEFLAKGAATTARALQATPDVFSGNQAGANQTMATPITLPGGLQVPTLESSTVGQNLGSALEAASAGAGLSSTLPAIASNQILGAGVSGAVQGGLGGLGQYAASSDRPDLKTPQGIGGGLLATGQGIAGGFLTGAGAAAVQPAMTGQSNLTDLFKNKSDQIINDKVWQMVKDPSLEPNTNKATMTGTEASVQPTTVHDQQLIEAAKPYVTDNPIQTKENLQNGVATQSQALQEGLVGQGGTWSENNLQGELNNVKVPLKIRSPEGTVVVKNVNNYVMELANDPTVTRDASGSLNLSKLFRQGISAEYGENIWNKDTPDANYIRNVNRMLNDFTSSHLPDGTLPDGTPFKSAMQQISLLSEARDNVEIPKEGKQTGTNALGKGLRLGKVVAKPLLQGVGLGEIARHIP